MLQLMKRRENYKINSVPQNSSDDLCLLFCLYLSSMPVTLPLSRCDMSMLTENKHQVNGNTMLAINQLVKNVLVNETQVEERVEILRTNLRRKKHFKNVLKILLKSKSYLQSGINLFGIFREIWLKDKYAPPFLTTVTIDL